MESLIHLRMPRNIRFLIASEMSEALKNMVDCGREPEDAFLAICESKNLTEVADYYNKLSWVDTSELLDAILK